MIRISCLVLSMLSLFLGCGQIEPDYSLVKDRVNSYQRKLIEYEITGSNVFHLFHNGKIQFESVANSGDSNDLKISDSTIFPIYSMTKPITTVAMMILFEEGKYDFEDNISLYMPEFDKLKCKKNGKPYECINNLKIIHLITHTSGFKYYYDPSTRPGDLTHADTAFSNLQEFIDSLIFYQPLEFEPGSSYAYGLSVDILGRLIEVLSGQSFYGFLKKRIFDPLEMNDTKFHLTKADRERFQPLFMKNTDGSKNLYTRNHDDLKFDENSEMHFGGGGLVSTMSNYSNFCEMLVNDGVFRGNRILSVHSIKKITEPYIGTLSRQGNYNGLDLAFNLYNVQEPLLDGTNSSKGVYGWSGYRNTHFWIDPEMKLFGLFMSRTNPFNRSIRRNLRNIIYTTI